MTSIHYTSPTEMDVVRGLNYRPKRYFSVCPRAEWMSGIIVSVQKDTVTDGTHTLQLGSVTGTTAMAGMTADIGTAPGLSDIGKVRVREDGTTTLRIALTSYGELPIEPGYYVTVREEFRPWQTGFRLVPVLDGDGLITNVLEYMDYDNAFGSPHDGGSPKVNIYGGRNAGMTDYLSLKPADWCDSGDDFRTVHLLAGQFKVFSTAANPTVLEWDLGDGTIVSPHDEHDAELDVQFPAGFRYIHLTATDEDGFSHTMHFPIWAHHRTLYPPLAPTAIPSDETQEWREMTLEFSGTAGAYADDVIPQGCACCYWEGSDLFANGAQPEGYRDHAYGWVIEDTTTLTLNGSYSLRFAGAGWWLDHFDGPTQALRDVGIPTAWHEIRGITRNRALFFSFLHFCNISTLVNIRFYNEGFSQATLRINLEPGTIWQQNLISAARYSVSVFGSDSFGNLIVDREYNHLSAIERASLQPLLELEAGDWLAEGIRITTRNETNYNRVEGAGNIWYLTELLFASAAPGKVKSAGTNIAQLEGQYLPFYTAQESLNDLTGQRWKALNNPQTDIPIPLVNNLDVIEPCWQRPIRLSWWKETARGTLLQQAMFIVKNVSVEHNFDYAEDVPPKRITWTVDRVTLGFPGVTVPVIQADGAVFPEPEPEPGDMLPLLLSGTQTLAAFGKGTDYYVTYDFLSANPTWYTVSVAGVTGAGNMEWFEPDAFSPFYLGTGDSVNGWFGFRRTTGANITRIYRITDIFGTPTITHQLSMPSIGSWLVGHTERVTPGFVFAMTNNSPSQQAIARTVDGTNWVTQNESTKAVSSADNVQISSRNAGVVTASWVRASGFLPDVFRSTDYGVTFPTTIPGGAKHLLHIPHASTDDSVIYCMKGLIGGNGIARVEGGVLTQITPTLGGYDCGYSGSGLHHGLRTWDLDGDYGIYCGVANGVDVNVMSVDRFGTITQIDNGSAIFTRCNFAGDDPSFSFWWDSFQKPLIGFRPGTGTIIGKNGTGAGELAGGALVRILNICGGPDA